MSTELSTIQNDDGFGSVPAETNSLIRGNLFRFVDGDYGASGDKRLNGHELIATSVATYWVKWIAKRPADIRKAEPGQRYPFREDLGDLDEARWELGLDGNPSDPWRDSRNLYLIDEVTGEEWTFTTSTAGGRRAVSELTRQIQNIRHGGHPRACPRVRLDSEKFKSKYGPRPRPKFTVTGWIGCEKPAQETPRLTQASRVAELIDDEIPFAWVAAVSLIPIVATIVSTVA
jgi:hypothetical protein